MRLPLRLLLVPTLVVLVALMAPDSQVSAQSRSTAATALSSARRRHLQLDVQSLHQRRALEPLLGVVAARLIRQALVPRLLSCPVLREKHASRLLQRFERPGGDYLLLQRLAGRLR